MSLFKTREWWRTQCGENEAFDNHSLLVTPLFGPDIHSVIIVGSHNGYLRIYKPSSKWIEEGKTLTGYKPTDIILESSLEKPIIDLNVGKFVSGSQHLHLAVLSPSNLIVYNVSIISKSEDEEDRCVLNIAYEHNLKRLGATLTVGPFGGVQGRDFFCVQCLDGTLLFYEQETFTFSYNLTNYLLPTPLIYVAKNDAFVTLNSGWVFECYRYQHIAEFDKNKEKQPSELDKSLYPDWKYNLGEPVMDVKIATLSSVELAIVVLGERSLYCLKDDCSLKYTKRLDYAALCFHVYVIEPDGVLMVMTVTETNTLMVYEGTTLKWTAQLSFAPVAVSRGNFQHLEGVIVLLSEKGLLEGCFLGSEPSLFVAPPVSCTKNFNYETAASDVAKYRKMLQKSVASDSSLTNVTAESEISISVWISPHLEPCPFNEELAIATEKHSMCRLSIELIPYAPLRQVQVSFEVDDPLIVRADYHEIANLCDRHLAQSVIHMGDKAVPASLEVVVTVSYENSFGAIRVLQRKAQVPLRLVARLCPPESGSSFSVTVKSDEPVVSLSQLFPEFIGEATLGRNNNAIGLQYLYTGTVVSIASGTSSNRYRLQSEDSLAVGMVARQLIARLNGYYSKKQCNCITSQVQLQILNAHIDVHFASRQEVRRIKEALDLLATQLRNIEKKMVYNFKERSTRSLKSLTFLLDDTFDMMFTLLDDLKDAQLKQLRSEKNLERAISFLLLLLQTNVSDDKYALVESAIGFTPQLHNDIDWEEIADAAVSSALRSKLRKSDSEMLKTVGELEPIKDVTKLKKRIAHLVERLTKETDDFAGSSASGRLEDVEEVA
ncbi:protein PTHB1 [Diprion similis]|uniref:protein PTHB1 n=1 Tax=Diprion similis TaxID=362088 RepID=UPI001EF82C0F|nr:protein PTHB1 [Diprion similis]